MASSENVPTIGQVIEGLQEFVRLIRLVKRFTLASMVLYVYSYVLTLDSEFSVMWKASWGYGKCLYFVLRYGTLVSTIFLNIGSYIPGSSPTMYVFAFCKARNIIYWTSAVIIALATDLGLQLRVYALYRGNRKILYLLVLSTVAMVTSFATFLVIILRHDQEKLTYLGPGTDMYVCNGSVLPPVFDRIWIAKIVSEALMFVLALKKGIASLSEYNGVGAGSRLVVLLVKDSVLYFFVSLVFCLMNPLVWAYAGQNYIELTAGLTLAMGSIMSQRLMVNIRMQVMDNVLSSTGSDMQYAQPVEFDYSTSEGTTGVRTQSTD